MVAFGYGGVAAAVVAGGVDVAVAVGLFRGGVGEVLAVRGRAEVVGVGGVVAGPVRVVVGARDAPPKGSVHHSVPRRDPVLPARKGIL
jgi:hypothetical protein